MSSKRHSTIPPPNVRSVTLAGPAPSVPAASNARGPLGPVEHKAVEKSSATTPTHDQIARAAYLRWLAKGGDPVNNWIEAERELKATPKKA